MKNVEATIKIKIYNWALHIRENTATMHVLFIGYEVHHVPYIMYRIVVLGLISGIWRTKLALYMIQDGCHGSFIIYDDHTGY